MRSIRILLVLFLAIFIAGKASSQSTIIVFSENGEKFTAYLNGSLENSKPAPRVEAHRPGGPTFKLRVLFEDANTPEISKTIFNSPGPDMFYVVKKNEKGKMVLEKSSSEYVRHDEKKGSGQESAKSDVEKPKDEGKTSESKSSDGGGKGCSNPMDEGKFIASREMISNAPFDPPRLTHAKKVAEENCLTTTQIIDLIYVFSGESTRLNFAKFAYKHCFDPKNYNQVKEALRKGSQDDLQRYIDSEK